MNKTICFVDVETTGLNPNTDRILQISAVKVDKLTFENQGIFDHYIKPEGEYTISAGATEVHGLTNEFIDRNGVSLKSIIPKFLEFIAGSDLGGYNSNQFDWKFIYNEFQRVGFELPMDGTLFYDVLAMERKINPNNLGAVYERYTGHTMEQDGFAAHNSLSDVLATARVMAHQMKTHYFEEVDAWTENQLLSPEGSIRDAQRGGIVFSNGKYRDTDVYEVLLRDPDYIRWWSQKVASKRAYTIVKEYLKKRVEAQMA